MVTEVLVDGPDGLTADWLGSAMGVDVSSVTVTPIGTGQTGSSFRLTVTYASDVDLPGNVRRQAARQRSRCP